MVFSKNNDRSNDCIFQMMQMIWWASWSSKLWAAIVWSNSSKLRSVNCKASASIYRRYSDSALPKTIDASRLPHLQASWGDRRFLRASSFVTWCQRSLCEVANFSCCRLRLFRLLVPGKGSVIHYLLKRTTVRLYCHVVSDSKLKHRVGSLLVSVVFSSTHREHSQIVAIYFSNN